MVFRSIESQWWPDVSIRYVRYMKADGDADDRKVSRWPNQVAAGTSFLVIALPLLYC